MATRFLSSKDVAHVPKFDGTNFCNWKFQLFMVFDHFKVSNIVLGTEPLPRLLNTTSPAGVTTNNAVEIELWIDRDASARIAICGTLEAKWQNSLINCKTAEAMWKRLTSQFEQVAKEDQFQLIQRFFDYKYQSQLSVMDNITAIETIAAQLADINAQEVFRLLILGLSCSFSRILFLDFKYFSILITHLNQTLSVQFFLVHPTSRLFSCGVLILTCFYRDYHREWDEYRRWWRGHPTNNYIGNNNKD